jgi:hypothetical protein
MAASVIDSARLPLSAASFRDEERDQVGKLRVHAGRP